MKFLKGSTRTTLLITFVVIAFSATSAFAGPSAKFAATWSKGILIQSAASTDGALLDADLGMTLATIKVPQDKELLVGVSAEIGLVTDTSIKGKNGGAAKALAGAGAWVVLVAVPVDGSHGTFAIAEPGPVALSRRIQVLNATLGGVITGCTAGDDLIIDVATECDVEDEEIGLMLDTMASHHFNFVLPNMDQGEYNIKAFFITGAAAYSEDLTVITGGTVEASASATALVRKTMVTVQQVRAAAGGLMEFDIVPQ